MLASNVGRIARHGLTAVKLGPTDTSLDISFLGGPLDGRITFTRASTATYFDTTGTLQTAATNAPRFDNDPVTHAPRGLLIEEARTNIALQSGFASGWNSSASMTFTPNAAAGLDGANTAASLLASDATSTVRQINQPPLSVVASTTYTASVYMRSSTTPTNGYIQLNSGALGASVAYFDLSAGTGLVGADLVAGFTGKSVTIARAGAFWRCSFTVTTPVGGAALTFFIGPCLTVSASGDNRTYAGTVGQGIYVWGAQCEAGAFPTSYIPTAAAAVTRAIEAATMPLAAWFNTPSVGSAVVDAMLPQTAVGAVSQGLLLFDDGTSANRLILRNLSTVTVTAAWVSAGAGTAAPASPGNIAAGSAFKFGVSYSANTLNSALNGSAVTTGSGAAPVSLTTMRFGLNAFNGGWANGYIRRVRYWPRTLSNTELQQVTT